MKYNKLKRILDIIFSVILSITLSPFLTIIGITIKLDSDGPILYKQKRIGKDGKEFNIYKFRTMSKDNNVKDLTERDKVTKIGRILRQTGLDELPQLYNILTGDMSFIGPRPLASEFYSCMTDNQKKRIKIKPGLLGPIKCTLDSTSMIDRIDEDIKYVENLPLLNDIKIIFEFILKYDTIVSSRKKSAYGNKENIIKQTKMLKESKEKTTNNIVKYNLNNNYQTKNLKKLLVLTKKQ